MKVSGKCGSVRFRLIPAPKGTGIVAARASKKLLVAAGVTDVYTCSTGKTKTLGNFIKAGYDALRQTYAYLSPDMWAPTPLTQTPYQQFTDFLADGKKHGGKKEIEA